jgi:NTE family protein
MNNIDTLVLSGGSLKGIAHIGAFRAFQEKDMIKNIKTIAGTSIGGIIGSLFVIGYTPNELEELVNILDFKLMRDIKIEKILNQYGVDDGKKMEYVIGELFKAKDISENITFQDLYKKTNIELILTSVCINDKKLYDISHKTFPDMKVITGLRMTSSIPFWFVPVSYENKLFIDGGLMNNFPIDFFADKIDRVIGVYLCEERIKNENIGNIETFLFETLDCIFEGITHVLVNKYEKRTVKLHLPKINILNIDIDKKVKKSIYNCGYKQTIKFLESL